jgi:CRP-like cAMP-binding protein
VPKSQKAVALSTTPRILAGIGRDELKDILGAAEVLRLSTGQIIFREGSSPSHLYLLKSGRAKFHRLTREGDEVLLSVLVVGDAFGLGTLLARPVPYIGTAVTTRDSELLAWKASRIRKLAMTYPRLAENALSIVLHYLAEHMDRLFNLVTCTAAQRLARVIVDLGEKTGRIVPTGVEVHATNDELAALATVSSFTVSRLLNAWERSGTLTKSRGKVFIHSPEKLLAD